MHPDKLVLHESPASVLVAKKASAYGNFKPHHHNAWEIIYQVSGHIQTQQGKERIDMYPGMILIHPPRVAHADFASGAYEIYYILCQAPDQMPWPRVCYDDGDSEIGRVCAAMVQEWQRQTPERDQLLGLLMAEMDLRLRRSQENHERTKPEQTVTAAVQWMEEHFQETLTVGKIAQEVGVSVSSLHAHFLAQRGQTPMEFLQAARLRHALSLLHHTVFNLETIAEQCGYNSASHLSRHVKASTNRTPGQVRSQGS
jgi:AraC-like DNA-binding protein